jgi:RecJ-like exonuclease
MIPPDADRPPVLQRLARYLSVHDAESLIDADDLLVVDLRCPTCRGDGDLLDLRCDNCGASASLPLGMTCENHLAKPSPCPTCHGSGRRDVVVVDADLLRRIAEAALSGTFPSDFDLAVMEEWAR